MPPTCSNSARDSSPPYVMSVASAGGESSWSPDRATDAWSRMSLAISSTCNLWIEQVSKPFHVLISTARTTPSRPGNTCFTTPWARTTGDVLHPEQAPDYQPGLPPFMTRQLEGDYEYIPSTILTKTAEEHSGRAAISVPNFQGQERFPQRHYCKSPHCAQAENAQVWKALWPLCHLQQKSRAWNWYKPLSRPTLLKALCGSTNLHQQTSGGQFSLILPVAPTILPTRENQELPMSTQDSHVQTASSTNLA